MAHRLQVLVLDILVSVVIIIMIIVAMVRQGWVGMPNPCLQEEEAAVVYGVDLVAAGLERAEDLRMSGKGDVPVNQQTLPLCGTLSTRRH